MSAQRIGVFGGTFNPVHNGHLNLVRYALKALSLDRMLVIPDSCPPHKHTSFLASDEDRLAMCRLAFQEMREVTVDEREIRRGGLSYTSDTLTELTRDYPGADLYFLTGSDMFLTVQNWHESGTIAALCTVVGLLRPPDTMESLRNHAEWLNARGWKTVLLEAPVLEASSTEIRSGVTEDLPCAVEKYIRSHSLYGFTEGCEFL